jgi:peptidyl-prolyl cis-trans isomerase SurA
MLQLPALLRPVWPLAMLLALAAAPAVAAGDANAIDRIQIVVNDEVITAREVDERVRLVRQRLAAQNMGTPAEAVLRRQVMERMAVERLQLQVAAVRGLSVSNDQLERAVQQIADQNHKTPDQIKREAEREPGGFRALQQELRTQLLIQQLLEREVYGRVIVTEHEVENFLGAQAARGGSEEFNLSHILIAVPEKASAEAIAAARQKAEELHAELRRGAEFGPLAVAHSQGQNALEGGGLGWRASGQLPDLFVNALRNLKPGDVSEVLRSPSGFHLLRLNARRGGVQTVNVTQTHARHILIKTSELVTPAEAQRRIGQLRERLLAGQDFPQTARAHSEDLGSAANGGDLGWVNPGQTVPEFEKVMNALKPGELSEPVKSPFGIHLIQVVERRERDVSQEREIAQARNQIHARKAEERYEQWLRQLRDEAYVEYRLESAP